MAKAAKMMKREVVEAEPLQGAAERKIIRSQYLAIKSLISDKRDDLTSEDSNKFNSIFSEVESLHQLVQKPREQVADAEALLDIANSLVTAFRSQANEGMTPSDFVTALLRRFGLRSGTENVCNGLNIVSWGDIGCAVSRVFRKAPGCCTMIGPMKSEMKQRRSVVHRKRTMPIGSSRPEELAGSEEQGTYGTDKNMVTMFEILRKKRMVRFESLVLNRASFSQTIENIFALSFLVKDGRVEITMNDAGHHLVCPRNAPAASAIRSGHVSYHHFVCRFDYKDWKLMTECVEVGEELMPHRCSPNTAAGNPQAGGERMPGCSQSQAPPTTPVRKFSRNRGLVVQEQSVGNCSSEEREILAAREAVLLGRGKRVSFCD